MGRRPRPPKIEWTDLATTPKGPTVTVAGARKLLDFRTDKSVYKWAWNGPEHGGFPAYTHNADGTGWQRKNGTQEGIMLMFFEDDLKAWKARREWIAAHPLLKHKKLRLPTYSEEEKQHVLTIYKLLGPMTRTALRKQLVSIDYVKVKFPDGRLDTTGWLLKKDEITGCILMDTGETREIVLPAREIEVLKRGAYQWNEFRSYPKLKKILDDAGILPAQREKTAS